MSDADPILGKLLVVDDNEMNRDVLSRRLSRRGHNVAVAEDGRKALDTLARETFDMVLLDVTMPGLDGFETLAVIRETNAATDLPVIMVTARDQSEDIVKALQYGANDYVTKPLDFPVVAARVQSQLSLKRAVDRIRELERSLTERNTELESANKRMKRDLDAAAEIQKAGLPRALPQAPGVNFAWAYQPCDELGGDSLNIIQLDQRYIGLYVLDVSGHGVPAALLSVTLNRELTARPGGSSFVTESADDAPDGYRVTQPASLATKLNRVYPMDYETRQFFTVVYGLFDTATHQFCFVGAGHPGPISVNNGNQPVLHECPGFPIGVVENADYDETVVQLEPGDRIFLYSDGIIEETNAGDEQFGRERLIDVVRETRDLPLQAAVDTLLSRVVNFSGDGKVRDDLSILAMEVTADARRASDGER